MTKVKNSIGIFSQIQKQRSSPGQQTGRGHTPEANTREEESSKERSRHRNKESKKQRGVERHQHKRSRKSDTEDTHREQKAREDAQRQPCRHRATCSKRRYDIAQHRGSRAQARKHRAGQAAAPPSCVSTRRGLIPVNDSVPDRSFRVSHLGLHIRAIASRAVVPVVGQSLGAVERTVVVLSGLQRKNFGATTATTWCKEVI